MALKFNTTEKSIKDYILKLKINSDQTKAYIEASKNTSLLSANKIFIFPDKDEILEFLDENGVIFGIDDNNINALIATKTNKATLVASALMPIKGEDAIISYNYDVSKKINLVQDENGNIDFKSLNWFSQVRAGDLVATKIPAQKGIDGKNIKGEAIIASPGKDLSFLVGKNIQVNSTSDMAIAKIDGILEIINDKIDINEILRISGDIDTSVGNINFIGDIFVQGDIKSGFKVEAGGSLNVEGVIESSDIFVGNDLIVKGGIKGSDTTKIVVNGAIICKFIENANIFVHSDINTDFIIHSNIISGGKLVLKGKKSVIAGGELVVRDSITTSVIGSHMGTKTDISLGVNIEQEASLLEKKSLLDKLNKDLNKIKPIIDTGKEMMSIGAMDPKRKETFSHSMQEYSDILEKINLVSSQLKEIENEISKYRFSYLIAKDTIYPGVSVTILRYSKYINDFLGPSKVFLKNGEVIVEKG